MSDYDAGGAAQKDDARAVTRNQDRNAAGGTPGAVVPESESPPGPEGESPPYFPEFRAGARGGGLGAPGIGLIGITAGLAQLARAGAPPILLIGIPVLLVLLFVALRIVVKRSATLTDVRYLTVRTPFRTRRTAWRDIQALEIERNVAAMADSSAVAEFAILYDSAGHRLVLPHLNSTADLALHEDVHDLRRLWERLRGPGWAPLPAVGARIAKVRRGAARGRAWMVGVLAGAGTSVVMVVFLLLLLFAGVLDDLDGAAAVVFSPAVFLFVPAVLCGTVSGLVFARRQRAEHSSF